MARVDFRSPTGLPDSQAAVTNAASGVATSQWYSWLRKLANAAVLIKTGIFTAIIPQRPVLNSDGGIFFDGDDSFHDAWDFEIPAATDRSRLDDPYLQYPMYPHFVRQITRSSKGGTDTHIDHLPGYASGVTAIVVEDVLWDGCAAGNEIKIVGSAGTDRVTAGTEDVYLEGTEITLDGSIGRCTGLGDVRTFVRGSADTSKNSVWIGNILKSEGAHPIDAFAVWSGVAKQGLDLAKGTFTNNAAIVLKDDQRIFWGAASNPSATPGYPPYSDSIQVMYLDASYTGNYVRFVRDAVAVFQFTSTAATLPGTLAIGGAPGFNGTSPVAKPTITGSRGGNAALASLLTALAATGLLTDGTSP
jgi:hypothetical protein